MASAYYAKKINDDNGKGYEMWRVFEVDSVTLAVFDMQDFATLSSQTAAQKKADVKSQWLAYKTANPLIGPL
jgi:hypothetical protein